MRTIALLLLTLCVALPVSAEGDAREAKQGHLVIVGGGLQADNEPVYRAVLDRIPDDGTLGVLPTASGIPEESGPGHVADFQQYAGPNQKIVLLDIRNGDTDKANDPEWVEKIRNCDGLWFTGGDQSRIVATFRPQNDDGEHIDTPAYDAMWDVLHRGGVIGGTSAGAAMMSDPMIKWGNSHEALLLGIVNDVPDFGVGVAKGMGFLPDAIVDQHFFARGRLGRLLVAMRFMSDQGVSGFGVGENTALVVDRSDAAPMSVIGPNGVLSLTTVHPRKAPIRTRLPLTFYSRFLPDGASLKADGWAGDRFADSSEIEQWLGGAPRSYEGPPAVAVSVLAPDEGSFVLRPNEHTPSLRAATMAALTTEREATTESLNP